MSAIDDYLAAYATPAQRKELERIRAIIKQVVPESIEVISYGIPTFKYRNKNLIHFAAFKNHMSIFPGAAPVEAFKDQLKDYKLSKGTIQFTLDNPIPDELLRNILAACLDRINN